MMKWNVGNSLQSFQELVWTFEMDSQGVKK